MPDIRSILSLASEWTYHYAESMLWMIAVATIFVMLASAPVWRFLRKGARARRHQRFRSSAQRAFIRLTQVQSTGQQIAYLRLLNPFVFEELILDAFERAGHKVHRNRRYTGDDGIDGAVVIDGVLHLVQAKRYAKHIKLAHVQQFVLLVRRRRCRGLFCHTGKTGASVRALAKASPEIRILSGATLLGILLQQASPDRPPPVTAEARRELRSAAASGQDARWPIACADAKSNPWCVQRGAELFSRRL